MPAKHETPVTEIFQIKVTLLGSDPPIWRRLLVSANLTLAALHNVLQVAMGWDSSHLYEFRKGKQFWGRPNPEERFFDLRSEERRVGKECRSRWSPDHGKIGEVRQ